MKKELTYFIEFISTEAVYSSANEKESISITCRDGKKPIRYTIDKTYTGNFHDIGKSSRKRIYNKSYRCKK